MKCSLFPFFFVGDSLGGDLGSGSGSKFNRAGRVGLGQTISGTGRVRASVLSPCRPLLTAYHCSTEARLGGVQFPPSFDSRLVLRQSRSTRLEVSFDVDAN